jgi:hypothetical protein
VYLPNYEFLVSNIFQCVLPQRKEKSNNQSLDFTGTKSSLEGNQLAKSNRHPDALVFYLSSIVATTDNFSPTNKLGQCGFSSVFNVHS